MKRTISVYDLVQAYRQEYNTLPTFGVEAEVQRLLNREMQRG